MPSRAALDDLRGRYTAPEEQVYLRTHAERYGLLVQLVEPLRPRTLLVVGATYEGELLRASFPNAVVNTLGWQDHRFPLRPGEEHFEADLNLRELPELPHHDVIVCGEVIEHLHVAPVGVLRSLATGLRPGGHLILQTPNATALPKRLRMLFGRNPYDPIREDDRNPGHYHEYTVPELLEVVGAAGFEVVRHLTANYFDHGSWRNRAYRALGRALPPTLREGITVVARSRR